MCTNRKNKMASMILIRIVSSTLIVAYECTLYFVSLLGPAVWLCDHRDASAPLLVTAVLLGYIWAGAIFIALLVATKRTLLAGTPTGRVNARTPQAAHWYYSATLMSILDRSPFRAFAEISIIAPLFLRAMGGRIPFSTAFGLRALVFEPWLVDMGENVGVGAHAIILGHVAVGEEIILGKVAIGDNVTIGMRSVIFPDVRIGKDACIAAGAVVTRGTVIPDGETWAGVPAKPLHKH